VRFRDVMCSPKVRELAMVAPKSQTLDKREEWKPFREEKEIKFLELLWGNKPDNLCVRSIKAKAVNITIFPYEHHVSSHIKNIY